MDMTAGGRGAGMFGDVIFLFAIGALLTATAYASLRFTTIDPQMPKARSRCLDLAVALGASLLLFGTELQLPVLWTQFFAYLAVTLIMTPAIVPPYRLIEREDPSWVRRQWRSFAGTKAGALPRVLLIFLGGFIAAAGAAILPGADLPSWFLALSIAAGFSIWTRPFSVRLPTGNAMPIERASADLAHALLVKRWIALIATVVWLALALPLLENHYSDAFEPIAFAVALLIGLLLS